MDFPDLKQATSLKNAHIDDIYRTIEDLLDGGPEAYEPPEPYQDLMLGIRLAQQRYLKERKRAPEESLENLRRWIEDATLLLRESQPPAPEQLPLPGIDQGGSSAQPEPAPQSDLIPFEGQEI